MKKILPLILVMMTIAFQSMAQSSNDNPSTKNIVLEVSNTATDNTKTHRAPMHINIEAFYNAESHTIEICYDGEADGEVFIYQNENIIGYDSQINTSIQIPATPGLYRIEIVGGSWTAEGYIQL